MGKPNLKFSGLTDEQVLQLFEQIASTVDLMSSICREKADEHGNNQITSTFHALDTMLRGVGAMADMPTGGNCVGDFAAWMVGPNFNKTTGGEACARP
jgi:hypothetical protein